jgi:acyl-CoA synthetase (AMP-forming)/AMP-acid ligase II
MNNLWQVFENTLARCCDRPAILQSDTQHSFRNLAGRAQALREVYRAAGIEPGARVLLWMQNDVSMAAALLACWAEDAIAVLADASGKRAQLEHAVAITQPALLVSIAELPCADIGVAALNPAEVPPSGAPASGRQPRALPTDPASIVFTSGSTGWPKGVVQSHGNLLRACRAVGHYMALEQKDSVLCPVPWSFDYGYGQLLSTLLLGLSHVIPALNNPSGICEALEQHRPSVLAGTPAVFSYLVGGMSPIAETRRDSVRLLTSSGGRVAAPVRNLLFDFFEQSALVLNYGLTESYRSCYLPPAMAREHGDALGFSIPGTEVVVINDRGERAAPFEEGEIIHRGDYLCMGYWGNPEATAACLRPDPFALPGLPYAGRCLYTGDIGYLDGSGLLHFIGRRDRLIKSMGVRVSPQDV